MNKMTLSDIDLRDKVVLMRVDFNVPLSGNKIASDQRIVAALPSLRHAVAQGAKLVLMTHLGRPEGRGLQPEFSVRPVADRLRDVLGQPVGDGPEGVVGQKLDRRIAAMRGGDVLLVQNLRFHPGETMPDKAEANPGGTLTPEQQQVHDAFVHSLARNGDIYVNDAFAASHRRHASMYGIPKAIQSKNGPAVAGFLVERELQYLDALLLSPRRPFVALLGGAKISDKIKLISNLLPKVDRLLIGGAMAYTLLKAKGMAVGRSRIEDACVAEMRQMLDQAGNKIVLPSDHVATDRFDPKTRTVGQPVPVETASIPDNLMGMDLGGKTIAAYGNIMARAATILWNGPMGVFELDAFSRGTCEVAKAIAKATAGGAISVVGGGDTGSAVETTGYANRMSHVSTGGGACLEFL